MSALRRSISAVFAFGGGGTAVAGEENEAGGGEDTDGGVGGDGPVRARGEWVLIRVAIAWYGS